MTRILENILQFELNMDGETRYMNNSDINSLLQSYSLIERARDDFLAQLLTFEEYLDLLELHEVNVDSYLDTLDKNLTAIGAL